MKNEMNMPVKNNVVTSIEDAKDGLLRLRERTSEIRHEANSIVGKFFDKPEEQVKDIPGRVPESSIGDVLRNIIFDINNDITKIAESLREINEARG